MTRPFAPSNPETFDKGLATRREVLGDAYVDAALKNVTDFNIDLQEWVTQSAWGEVWTRPGLDRRTRSMLNLAMLTALNRPHELKTHLQGALNNGVTVDEIKEVLLQTAVYAGVPAGNTGMAITLKVLKELGRTPAPASFHPPAEAG
jgi:4-carboxymuconolactone decarboxylase